MLKHACITPLLFLALLSAGARPAGDRMITVRDAGRVPSDTSATTVRPVPAHKIEEFRRDADFRYDRENEPLLSLRDYILAWLRDKLGRYFTGVDGRIVWKAVEYAVYGIVTAAVLLVIIKLLGADLRGLFFSPKKMRPAPDEAIEHIENIDFDALIARSLEGHDYRAVVRLLYHKSLKELSALGLVHWKIDKTNNDYLFELSSSPLGGDFTELTRIFEYIWYGNFDLPAETFVAIRELYERFYNALSEGKS